LTTDNTYPDTPDLTVVVPVFNEERSLEELAEEIVSAVTSANLSFEVIFVDDGSSDASWNVIEELHTRDSRFTGIRFRRNYGKSAALGVGFERARGIYVATMDADLQDDPAELPPMVELLGSGVDLVSGWKRRRQDPISKKIPSRFFNFVTRRISGIPLHDFNCGLKVYRNEVIRCVRVYGELHRYIPLLAKWEGYTRIAEKEVLHRPRKYGATKFGIERFVRGFLDLLTVLFITRFARRPMHFFGTLGTLAFVGGFLISLYLSYEKLVLGLPLGDRPLLLFGALLILLGAQLFLAGLLGEMVIKQRMEDASTYDVVETVGPGGTSRTAGTITVRQS
jgi:glycosyltransferase involved in cell wall biosynthesis